MEDEPCMSECLRAWAQDKKIKPQPLWWYRYMQHFSRSKFHIKIHRERIEFTKVILHKLTLSHKLW